MPLYTQNYSIAMQGPGERPSASIERSRMTIIDTQMAFLADLIGDGRISGWVIVSDGSLDVRIHEEESEYFRNVQ